MIFPLVLELADDRVPVPVPVPVLVAVACPGLASRSRRSIGSASSVSKGDWEIIHFTNAASDAHRNDPTFGYRFIADNLHAAGRRPRRPRRPRLPEPVGRVGTCAERCDGIVFRPAADERPRPQTMDDTRGAAAGDQYFGKLTPIEYDTIINPQVALGPQQPSQPNRQQSRECAGWAWGVGGGGADAALLFAGPDRVAERCCGKHDRSGAGSECCAARPMVGASYEAT